MQIAFKKVIKDETEFSLKENGLGFFGKVYTKSSGLISCAGEIKGQSPHICDRCGEDIILNIDENINLLISDGIYKPKEEDEIEVIEFYDEVIDFSEILASEVEAIKSDYHYCDKCKNIKE